MKITLPKSVVEQVLEAMDEFMTDYKSEDGMNSMKHYAKKYYAAATSLRQAIAQTKEQEPQDPLKAKDFFKAVADANPKPDAQPTQPQGETK